MNPDNICEKYANKKIEIKIWLDESTIFIEGSSEALKFK